MKKQEFIAIFMIFLVVFIPICSADAFAEITSVRATGADYVFNEQTQEGYAKSADQITVNATVDTAGVSKDNIKFEGQPFDQCTNVGTNSICTKSYALSGAIGGIYIYTVSYAGSTRQGKLIIDKMPPVITSFSIFQNGAGNVTIRYQVNEKAFENNAQKCSAIKKIEFVVDNSVAKTLDLNFTPNSNCVYPEAGFAEETITISGAGLLTKRICIRAYDNLNQMGEACGTFVIDNAPPKPSNLRILDQGEPIRYVAPTRGAFPVIVSFDMEEKNLTAVYADLSDLTEVPEFKSQYSNVEFRCDPVSCNGKCVCEAVSEINMQRYSGGTITVPVHAEDASGNIVDVPLTLSLELDNTAPSIKSIEAAVFNNQNYVGPTYNKIIARIAETGSGFNQKKVYMDLSQLMGQDYKTTVANECKKEGDDWICSWDGVTAKNIADGTTLSVAIVYPSQDDAGNFFAGESKVIVDSVAPELNMTDETTPQFYFASKGGPEGYPETIAKEGDCLNLVTIIKDRLPVVAFADFSYISGKGIVQGVCSSPVNGYSTCVWQPSYDTCPIKAGVDVKLPLTLYDLVYNNRTYLDEIKITVYGVETTAADYWNVRADAVSPYAIDKQMVTLYDPFAYQPVHLIKRTAKQTYPADIQITECTGDVNYLVSTELMPYLGYSGTDINDYSFYIKYNLAREVPPGDSITINCKLKIITKIGGRTVSGIEYENVTATINYYNNPLGELSQSIKDTIAQLKKDNKLIESNLIGDLKDFLDKAKLICGLWNALVNIPTVLGVIVDFLSSCSATGFLTPICKPAQESFNGARQGLNIFVGHGWINNVNELCKIINCGLLQTKWFGGSEWAKFQRFITEIEIELPAEAIGKEKVEGKKIKISLLSVEESIVWSIIFLCVPGIINFLQKWRAIECEYICCLKETSKGYPKYICDKQREFMQCKFVWGQIFNAIPFSAAWNAVGRNLANLFANPTQVVNLLADVGCDVKCASPGSSGWCMLCTATNLAELVADLLCDYFQVGKDCINFVERFKSINPDHICKDALKEEPCTL